MMEDVRRWVVGWASLAGCALALGCSHTAAPSPTPASAPAAVAVARSSSGGSDIYVSAAIGPPEIIALWSLYGVALVDAAEQAGHPDFSGELKARSDLADRWKMTRARTRVGDPYLDTLAEVRDAGFMAEYVLAFLARQGWTISGEELARLNVAGFTAWMAQHLPKSHEPETRVTFHLKAPVRPAPTPGAHIIGAEQIDVQRMSCAQIAPAIDRAVTDWDREAKTLTAVPLSVTSRALILPSLAVLARDDRALRDGVVLASGLVAEVMFDAGFCAVDREAWADAERLLRQTIGVAPMSAKARGELVQTLIMEKKLDDADAELDRAIAISDSVCQTAILWRKRGFILFDRRKMVESVGSPGTELEFAL